MFCVVLHDLYKKTKAGKIELQFRRGEKVCCGSYIRGGALLAEEMWEDFPQEQTFGNLIVYVNDIAFEVPEALCSRQFEDTDDRELFLINQSTDTGVMLQPVDKSAVLGMLVARSIVSFKLVDYRTVLLEKREDGRYIQIR